MKDIFSNEIDAILKRGIFLGEIGTYNWALTRSEVINALSEFKKLQIPILGGDVCEIIDENIQYNYDNWYYERVIGESNIEYVHNSIKKAIEYITNYPKAYDPNVFFVLVPLGVH